MRRVSVWASADSPVHTCEVSVVEGPVEPFSRGLNRLVWGESPGTPSGKSVNWCVWGGSPKTTVWLGDSAGLTGPGRAALLPSWLTVAAGNRPKAQRRTRDDSLVGTGRSF